MPPGDKTYLQHSVPLLTKSLPLSLLWQRTALLSAVPFQKFCAVRITLRKHIKFVTAQNIIFVAGCMVYF